MRRKAKKLLSFMLCVVLTLSICMPSKAADESNEKGVTFGVKLNKPSIQVSDQDQTLVMTLYASKAVDVDGIGFTVVKDEALQITSITGSEEIGEFPSASTNLEKGIAGWQSPNSENIANVTDLAAITFKIPANTPAGEYTIGVEKLELTYDYGEIWEKAASAKTTLTITEKKEGYTAGINTLTKEISVDEMTNVNIEVEHSSDTSFASGELILTYDQERMSFSRENSNLGTASVKDNGGTLILEDYGENKNLGTGVYTIAFKAMKDGNSKVSLTSAAFSNKEAATKDDLSEASISKSEIDYVIHKRSYKVQLPDIFIGDTTVEEGTSYTFKKADSENYDYGDITATMAGNLVDEIVENDDGTYTIENVLGNLIITGSRTEKTYDVEFRGNAAEEITDGAESATYNTDYTFTMPKKEGWAYHLQSITIGENEYTGYSVEDSVYTIPGSAIKGKLVITVNKSQTIASVTVEGSGAGAAAGYNPKAEIGKSYTLTLNPDNGYSYTVTATMNGSKTDVVDNENNTYTIANVSGDIVFQVDRQVIVSGVTAEEYLTLNGTKMWLIKNVTNLGSGKVPTYDGNNMYWSEKYQAYCYLIVEETLDIQEVKGKIDIADATGISVNYGMDVNMTGKVDANDAQLVYDMYNAVYNGFTDDVVMEKYLRADVNGDEKINVEDSAAIIANILK